MKKVVESFIPYIEMSKFCFFMCYEVRDAYKEYGNDLYSFIFLTLIVDIQVKLLTVLENRFQWRMMFGWILLMMKLVYLQVISNQLIVQMMLLKHLFLVSCLLGPQCSFSYY